MCIFPHPMHHIYDTNNIKKMGGIVHMQLIPPPYKSKADKSPVRSLLRVSNTMYADPVRGEKILLGPNLLLMLPEVLETLKPLSLSQYQHQVHVILQTKGESNRISWLHGI